MNQARSRPARLALAGAALAAFAGAQPQVTLDLATVEPADGVASWVHGSVGLGNSGLPVAGGRDIDGDGTGGSRPQSGIGWVFFERRYGKLDGDRAMTGGET